MLYRAHIFPSTDLSVRRVGPDGPEIMKLRFGSEEFRSAIFDGFTEFLAEWQAPVIREHTPNGCALGHVVGFDLNDDGVFAYVRPTADDKIGPGIASREIGFVSAGFDVDSPDSSGVVRPFALYELSIVDIPAFTVGQQRMRAATAEEIARVNTPAARVGNTQIAASIGRGLYTTHVRSNMHTFSSGSPGTHTQENTMEGMEELVTKVTAIAETIASLEARIAALESSGDDDMGDDVDMGAGMDDMRAENYALRKVIDNPALKPLADTLKTLAKVGTAECDKAAANFVKLAKAAPAPALPKIPPVVTQPAGASDDPVGDDADAAFNHIKLAREYQRSQARKGNTVSYEAALEAVTNRGV